MASIVTDTTKNPVVVPVGSTTTIPLSSISMSVFKVNPTDFSINTIK